jgi:ABC-type multidrug transport system ATPase subunit
MAQPDRWILRGVTLSTAAGETFVVEGPGAAGQSTLLRMLNRLVEPTAGTARVGARTSRYRAASREVGRAIPARTHE